MKVSQESGRVAAALHARLRQPLGSLGLLEQRPGLGTRGPGALLAELMVWPRRVQIIVATSPARVSRKARTGRRLLEGRVLVVGAACAIQEVDVDPELISVAIDRTANQRPHLQGPGECCVAASYRRGTERRRPADRRSARDIRELADERVGQSIRDRGEIVGAAGIGEVRGGRCGEDRAPTRRLRGDSGVSAARSPSRPRR